MKERISGELLKNFLRFNELKMEVERKIDIRGKGERKKREKERQEAS